MKEIHRLTTGAGKETADLSLEQLQEENLQLRNDQRAYALCIGADPDAEDFEGVTTAAIKLWQEYKRVVEDRDELATDIRRLRAALLEHECSYDNGDGICRMCRALERTPPRT